jgi:two-component system osmolarity sensor histidine kinase EnvZ
MLEDYLAFARGDGGEAAAPTDIGELLDEVNEEAMHYGTPIEVRMRHPDRNLVLPLKRQAFKRAVTNLVINAARFGDYVVIRAGADREWLRIEIDDDGPGIPPAERDNVFRPFYRLANGRGQDAGNTGLGLAIARDIARSHGGDIALGESSMGGLRATVRVPL